MGEFLGAILAYPTAIFTVALGLVLLYWTIVLVGLLDVDFLDPSGAAEAGAEGALEGSDAGAEAADGAEGPDAEASTLAKGLQALGLYQVPLTFSLSLMVFFCWVLCYLGMWLLRGAVPASWLERQVVAGVAGTVVGCGALALGLLATVLLVRPLRPMFAVRDAPRRAAFVGKVCTITSGRVDAHFGQAEIDDGGAGLRVDVRCFEENSLGRGSKALVYDYDSRQEVFHVSSPDQSLADGEP